MKSRLPVVAISQELVDEQIKEYQGELDKLIPDIQKKSLLEKFLRLRLKLGKDNEAMRSSELGNVQSALADIASKYNTIADYLEFLQGLKPDEINKELSAEASLNK